MSYNVSHHLQDSLQFDTHAKQTIQALNALKPTIKHGDVVTRTGNDFTSQSLRNLNRRDTRFSHAGIASIEHDSLFIYHAIGGEYNPNQTIKKESFEQFSTPFENNAVGIYRITAPKAISDKTVQQARAFFMDKILFDMDFDLDTDDKMYCTEFVYKCFLRGSAGNISFRHSFIKNFEFIGVDDITMDSLAKKIVVFNYKLY